MQRIDDLYAPYDSYVTKEHLLAKKELTKELCETYLMTTAQGHKEWEENREWLKKNRMVRLSLPRFSR